ncbi:MAG: hypothetical protein FIA97_02325 [Methylococcaceae bacterium]|nr:hypothetical protein [Methylococcaceae bacterium]
MHIQSSAIQSRATHSLQQTRTEQHSLQFWAGRRPSASPPMTSAPPVASNAVEPAKTGSTGGARAIAAAPLSPKDSLNVELIRRMIKAMTGKDWDIRIPEANGNRPADDIVQPPPTGSATTAPANSAGYGLVIDHYQSFQESETLTVQAEGKITTADGRQFEVALNLTMARSYQTEQWATERYGDAARIDPLVVNLGDGGAALDPNRRFEFDLNADGKAEDLAALSSHSGLLALDKNGDGHINDGHELFGALSGDGFAELAGYDEDGNGFIDEGDQVFAKLRIWLPEGGTDRLQELADAGIGALYLGGQDGQFRLTDGNNRGLGEVKSTGLYLREDGRTGTLQQIDYLA